MDLTKLSTEDLLAIQAGDMSKVSTDGLQLLKRQLEPAAPAKKSSVGSELVRGAEQLFSSSRTGLGQFGTGEEAARSGIAGIERAKEIAQEAGEGPSWDAVKQAYADKGLFGGVGEAISQVPRAVAGQGANIAAMGTSAAGGARVGAMFGPWGAAIGGALGAAGALLPQFMGANIERQVQEQRDAGVADNQIQVDRSAALSAAMGQSLAEGAGGAVTVGRRALGGILGKDLMKAGGEQAEKKLIDIANRSLTRTVAGGVARGAAAEIPVELAQQIMERAQAGLSLTDDDAKAEYGDTLYQTFIAMAPVGGAGAAYTRAGAKTQVKAQEAEQARVTQEQARVAAAEAEATAQAEREAKAAEPGYIPGLIQRVDTERAALSDLYKQMKVKGLSEEQHDALKVQAEEQKDKLKAVQQEYGQQKERIDEYLSSPEYFDGLVQQRAAYDEQIAQLKEQATVPGIDPASKKALSQQLAAITKQRNLVEKEMVARPEQLSQFDAAKRAAMPKPATFQELRDQERTLSQALEEASAAGDTATIAQAAEQHKEVLKQLNAHPQTKYEELQAKFEAEKAKEKPTAANIARLATQIEALKKKGADEGIYRERLAEEEAQRKADKEAAAQEEIAAFQQKAKDVAARAKNIEQLGQQEADLLSMQYQPQPSEGQAGIEGYQASLESAQPTGPVPAGTAEDVAAYAAEQGLPAPKEVGPFQPAQKRGSTTSVIPANLVAQEAHIKAAEDLSEKRIDDLLGKLSEQKKDFVKTEPDMQPQQHRARAKEADTAISNAELEFNEALGNLQSGTYLGGKNAAAGSSSPEGLINKANAAQTKYIDSVLKYVENERAAQGLAPLKTANALNFAYDARDMLRAAVRSGKPDEQAFNVLRQGIDDLLKRETVLRRQNVQLGLFGSVEQRVSKLKEEAKGEPEEKATYNELVKEKEILQRTVAGLEKEMAEHKEAGRVSKFSKRYEITANSLKQYKQALNEIDAKIAETEKGAGAGEAEFVADRLREAEAKVEDAEAKDLKAARDLINADKATPELLKEANRQAARAVRGQEISTRKLNELVLEAKQAQAGEGEVGVKETPVYAMTGAGTAKGMQALRGMAATGEQVGTEKGKTKYTKGVQQELPGIEATRTERIGPQQWQRYTTSHEREKWRMDWETKRKNLVAQLNVMAGNFKRAANQEAKRLAQLEAQAKQAEIALNKNFTGVSANLRDGVLAFETRLEELLKTNIEKSTPIILESQVKEARDAYNAYVLKAQPTVNKLTKTFYFENNAAAERAARWLDGIERKKQELADKIEVAGQGLYDGALQRIHRSTVLSNTVQDEIKRLDGLENKLNALKNPPTEMQKRMKEQRAVLGAAEARIAEAKQKAVDDARKAEQAMLEARDQTASVHYTVESVMVQMPDSKGGEPIMAFAVTEGSVDKARRAEINKQVAEKRVELEKATAAKDQASVNRIDRELKKLFAERANLGEAVRERVARTPELATDKELERQAEEQAASGKRRTLSAKKLKIPEVVSPTIKQLLAGEASLIKEPVTKYSIKAAEKTKLTPAARVAKTKEASIEEARASVRQKEMRKQINIELLEKGELGTFSPREIVRQIRDLDEVIADVDNTTAEERSVAREEKAMLKGLLKSNNALEAYSNLPPSTSRAAPLRTGTKESLKVLPRIDEAFDTEAVMDAKNALFRDADAPVPATPVDSVKASMRMAGVQSKMSKSGIKFVYAESVADAPVEFKEALRVQGVTNAKGAVLADGTVVVIGDMHNSMRDLEETVTHEVVGHYGVEGAIGEQGIERLAKQLHAKPGEINKIAAALGVTEDVVGAQEAAKAMGLSEKEAQMLVTRELIAHTAEAKARGEGAVEMVKSWIKTLVNAVRTWLKTVGMDDMSKASTKEIQQLVNSAFKQYVRNELPAYQGANGKVHFRWNKPAYATGYDAGAIALEQRLIGRQKNWTDNVRGLATGMYAETKLVDVRAPIERIAKSMQAMGADKEMLGMQTMYHVRSHDARMLAIGEAATNGPPKLVKEVTKDGHETWVRQASGAPGLKAITQRAAEAKGVGDANTTLRQFGLYLIARRAARVGIEKALGFDMSAAELAQYRQQFKNILDLHKNNAAFNDAAKMYADYNKALMNYLAQSGYISQATADALTKHGDYVGFYRQGDKLVDGSGTVTIGDISKQKYLQELVGGKEQIVDFQTSSLQNTALIMELALRNLATKNTTYMMESLGYAKVRKDSGPASPNVVRFKQHGKDMHAVIDSEASGIPTDLFMMAMEGVPMTLPTGVRLLQGPASTLRRWVTRMPLYAVRQIMRDSLASTIVSGSDARPITSALKQISSIMQGTNKTERILQEGGFLGGQQFSGSLEDMKKIMNDVAGGRTLWSRAKAAMDNLAMAADASARVTAYNSYVAQGLSNMEAQLAALEVMNFTKRGASSTAAFVSMMIPFFNAQMQGLNVLAKAATGTSLFEKKLDIQAKMLKRGFTLAGLTVLYAAAMQDDDAYKNATEDEKLMYWFVRLPGLDEPVRIPIPFEIGYIFKAAPEALVNLAAGDAKSKDVLKAFWTATVNTIPGGSNWGLPQAIKPLVEVGTNHNIFTGRSIESKRFEGVEPGMRYDASTSALAKTIGGVLNVSPIKLDHLVRGYLGSAGSVMAASFDPLLNDANAPERAERKLSELPFIGPAFQPNDGRGMINSAYDTAATITQTQGTYKKLIDDGKYEKAMAYAEANADLLAMASFAGSFKQRMGELAKQKRTIENMGADVMDAATKRELIDQIKQSQIALAKILFSSTE